ncbi:iron ABC transporter substrate-binding protein [Alicyclobacillus ferrooxydans]|uniref:Iron ABC transporter substrate-binding protein n=2 Tax=Alicyclobacillus ferrooxydans TaxID=471514 RepID=A0A0P9D3I4_9BACL|nr:iron ABC transporter substrate-binding protein [Alicyclobacillus ferrooxydans]
MISAITTGALVSVLAGCGTTTSTGSSNTTTGSGNAAASNSSSKSNSSSTSNETLVIYSAQGYDQAMADAFQKKTGIKVKLVDDSTGNIVAKMEAEKSNPHWDVAWFDGASTMQGLDNQGMLLTGWTPNDVSNYTSQGQSLIPSDKAYYPTGVTAAAAIGYNNKLVDAAHAPKDWSDLLNPYFKGAVGMNDPSISGPTFPYVAGMLQLKGTTAGEQFFMDLKNNGLKVFPTNGDTLNALVKGQIKVATIQDTALLKGKLKGDPITLVYPSSGTFSMATTISIDKNAPDMAAAKKFVEFVLSQQGQQVMLNPANGGSDSYYSPIIKGVSANPARVQSGINWVPVNPVQAAQNETQIKTWFHENITN